MLAQLERFVRGLPGMGRGDLRFLFRHGGLGPHDSIQAFVFSGEAQPSCVVKVSSEVGRETLNAEKARLERCGRALKRRVQTIPRVLGFHDGPAGAMLAETFLTGRRVKDVVLTDAMRAKLLDAVVDWLIDLNHPGQVTETDVDPVAAVAQPVAEYLRLFNVSDSERRELEQLPDQLVKVVGGKLPAVLAHGDLSDANILVEPSGAIAVVDWGEECTGWLPGFDLFHLLCSLAASRYGLGSRAAFERGFREAFLSDTLVSRQNQHAWRRYREALSLPPEATFGLFTLCWMRFGLHKLTYLTEATTIDESDYFADPQTEFPVTFFAEGACLNVALVVANSSQFALR